MSDRVLVRLFQVNGPGPFDGMYLKSFDVEANDGRGELVLTPKRSEARRFADFAEAFAVWHSVPKCRPRRPDGRPNKPLTAYHIHSELVADEAPA